MIRCCRIKTANDSCCSQKLLKVNLFGFFRIHSAAVKSSLNYITEIQRHSSLTTTVFMQLVLKKRKIHAAKKPCLHFRLNTTIVFLNFQCTEESLRSKESKFPQGTLKRCTSSFKQMGRQLLGALTSCDKLRASEIASLHQVK